MSELENLLEIKSASFKYVPRDTEGRGSTFTEGEDRGFELKDISLSVKPGERVLLCGKNGSGKSTLLSIIAGKRKAFSGTVTVLGSDAFDNTGLQKDVALIGEPWPAEALFSCTVEAVVTPCADPERRDDLARQLHLPMKASLNRMSSGQKRRVQILYGLMGKKRVIVCDEVSVDIDVAERVTLMNYIANECEKHGACCIYATHILDGVESWATRILMFHKGQKVRDESLIPYSASSSSVLPSTSLLSSLALEKKVTAWFLELSPSLSNLTSSSGDGTVFNINSSIFKAPKNNNNNNNNNGDDDLQKKEQKEMITFKNFTFRDLFENINHSINVGKRILLTACNAAGKSTLLSLLAGHVFFPNKGNAVCVDGRPCFQDTKAQEIIAFGGNWWSQTPGGEMHVRELVSLPLDDRAESLRKLLDVNLDWDVRHVSTGESKRIQLLLKLQQFRPVLCLDEATADLDVHMRAALLHFLYDESEKRGVTIIYCTHIFEGLGDWPTDVLFLDRLQRNFILHANNIPASESQDEEIVGEKLRRFVIQTLLELKKKEKWEEWYS